MVGTRGDIKLLGAVLYGIAVKTDNTVSDVVKSLGEKGVDEYFALAGTLHRDWCSIQWQDYFIKKFCIKRKFTVHQSNQPKVADMIDQMIAYAAIHLHLHSQYEACCIVSSTDSMAQLECGAPIYNPIFFDKFKSELKC